MLKNGLLVSRIITSSGGRCVAENLFVNIENTKIDIYGIPAEYMDKYYCYKGPDVPKFIKNKDAHPEQFYTDLKCTILNPIRIVRDITCSVDANKYDIYKCILVETDQDEKSYGYKIIKSDVKSFRSLYKIDSVYIYYYNDLVIPYFITEAGVYLYWGGLHFHTVNDILSYNTTEYEKVMDWYDLSDGVITTTDCKKINLHAYYKFPLDKTRLVPTHVEYSFKHSFS